MRRLFILLLILGAMTGLGYANYLICLRLLGLNNKSFSSGLTKISAAVKPILLDASEPRLLVHARKLLGEKGFQETEIKHLPTKHHLKIEVPWIQAANPYPPILSEYNHDYRNFGNFILFGYIGEDNRYHQLTYYGGEADTTPSFLVPKVRGPETGYGDYFVGYLVEVSRELRSVPEIVGHDGRVEKWQRPRITIDRIDWYTYRGGSYNGFEEIFLPPVMTLVELLLVAPVVWWFVKWRRRRTG